MKTGLRRWLEERALMWGVYEPVRNVYLALCNREHRRMLRELRELFAPVVHTGDIVFDVGANRGEFTALYRSLGARVVAIEPNPELASFLRSRFRDVEVVEAAIGGRAGSETLYLGTESGHSTISERWRDVSKEGGRFSNVSVEVRVMTLDELIAAAGTPQFVKLDVEGGELAALRGLSEPVDALLFEYQCRLFDDLEQSIAVLQSLATYEFGVAFDGTIEWLDPTGALESVRGSCAAGAESGDLFARRIAPP